MERKNKPWHAITLTLITTLIAELFFGTTPVSRAFILIPQLLFYGSGSILIREIARRRRFGWPAIILLGLAFGCIEEGLTLQSFFNPHFLGINLAQGRVAGINTLWVIHSAGYHCFWSICSSLLITELIFSKTAAEPWIGKVGVWISGIVFLVICLALNTQFRKMSGFNSTLPYYLGTLAVVGVLVVSAFKIAPLQTNTKTNHISPGFWLIVLCTFLIAASWLSGMFLQYILPQASPFISLGLALFTIGAGFFSLRYWSASIYWNNTRKCAVATGMIAAELLFGYFITKNHPVDHIGHIVIILIVLVLFYFLKRHSTETDISKTLLQRY
jgi:hypothetical protein